MPLKIELAPFERLLIDEAEITNTGKRIIFSVNTSLPVMRERNMIRAHAAVTPTQKIYLALQNAYIGPKLGRANALANAIELTEQFLKTLKPTDILRETKNQPPAIILDVGRKALDYMHANNPYLALGLIRRMIYNYNEADVFSLQRITIDRSQVGAPHPPRKRDGAKPA